MALAVLALVQSDAMADVVVMKNGDRITGDIKRVWDEELFIEPEYGDEFGVDVDAIESITSEREFEIELRDHSEIVGTVTSDGEGNTVLISGGETRPFPLSEIEELDEPDDYFDWSVSSTLSGNVSRGNSDNTNWLLQNYGMVKRGDHRHNMRIVIERQEKDGETTKEQDDVAYGYNWFFTDDWFLVGTASWRRDPQRDLDRRWTVGGGAGYQIWDDAHRSFRIGLTGDLVVEELAGASEESFAPRWGLRFSHELLGGDAQFFHNHDIWSYVTGRDNNVFETSTGVRYDLTDDVFANLQVNFNYETDPAPGADKEDVTYLIGVGVELD